MIARGGRGPRRYSKPFIVTLDTAGPRIVVSHQSVDVNGAGPRTVTQRIVTLEGSRASQHLPMTLDLLNRAGADLGRVDDRRGGRVRLSEERGARLALTLASVAPVQKPSRAALIRAGVSEMCDEEVYYWYAKMAGAFESSGANNALKALRVLLAGQ